MERVIEIYSLPHGQFVGSLGAGPESVSGIDIVLSGDDKKLLVATASRLKIYSLNSPSVPYKTIELLSLIPESSPFFWNRSFSFKGDDLMIASLGEGRVLEYSLK